MVPNITFRRMMGEYCVYSRRSISWLVCDNTLFLKTTTDTINLFEDQISYKKMSWYKEVAPAFV
ncbi:TfoX/Sxy family protein [Candidatus Peribacteria bacterium]|nr:TfoX/Sxy family protein [Candidatus Peribacteria bacterium]